MVKPFAFTVGGDTLVLNCDGLPISLMPMSTVNWREAVRSMYLDNVHVMEEYDDWIVRSPSTEIAVPAVIMAKTWAKAGRIVKFSRYNVYLRDNFHCQYCNEQFNQSNLTLDHVIPRLNGGKTTWDNISSACRNCNQEKSHFTKMLPIAKPRKPTYGELLERLKERPITVRHPSWNTYLGWPEDQVRLTNNLTVPLITNTIVTPNNNKGVNYG